MRLRGGIGGILAGAVLLLMVNGDGGLAAQTLPSPAGAPILTVSGNIEATNRDGKAVFDLALLQSLPQVTLTTKTPWTEGEARFNGVRVRDLLDRLGAHGATVNATAVDDYAIAIPVSDFRDYDAIIAYAENGKLLTPDNKGPLWIVYPFSAHPDINKDLYFARCVWQLDGLTVQ